MHPNIALSNIILESFNKGYRGYAVDVGASDGVTVNSTWRLEVELGWKVLSVEPNAEFSESLRVNRAFIEFCACSEAPGRQVMRINEDNPEAYSSLKPTKRKDLKGIETAKWRSVEVKVETVDRLLRKWEFPKLDVLCIDTEGTELDVIRGANLDKWQPKVIVSESWDQDGGEVCKYLEARRYERVMRHVHNDVYRRIG